MRPQTSCRATPGPSDADLDARLAEVSSTPKPALSLSRHPCRTDRQGLGEVLCVRHRSRSRRRRPRSCLPGPARRRTEDRCRRALGCRYGPDRNGQAVFFDALNPGVVSLPDVKVSVNGNEISATVPLALFPSQGFKFKDYTYNFWPRSKLSLANTVCRDFAPDNGDVPVGIVGKRHRFQVRAFSRVEACLCPARARSDVHSVDGVEVMEVSLYGLPPQRLRPVPRSVADAPFGSVSTRATSRPTAIGQGHQRFIGRFSARASASRPVRIGHRCSSRGDSRRAAGPATGPVHQSHLGLWFDSPADAVKAGCAAMSRRSTASTTPASKPLARATSPHCKGRCSDPSLRRHTMRGDELPRRAVRSPRLVYAPNAPRGRRVRPPWIQRPLRGQLASQSDFRYCDQVGRSAAR